ncbi:Myb/SANT-like domain containing protein [Trema orientale]|uniref:Myb/SANT-like domain containing protein n=1 Tax=Trema orientale TaxID=63057 RepID=A0A2P5BJE5_TREOI|nr:Myb/SANT-like domain containing protein [Trema orientale]
MSNALTRHHGTDRFYNPPAVRRHQELQLRQSQPRRQLSRPLKSEARVDSSDAEARTDSDESTLSRPSSVCSPSPSRNAALTNLDRIMESVTPFVQAQFFSEARVRGWRTREAELHPFFCLGDLWESFGEWSVYGVGVPLMLNGNDSVKQYYVPSLSGIQLYIDPHKLRRPGDDSDAESSRETSSAGSSDCEAERRVKGAVDGGWGRQNLMNSNSQRLGRLTLRDQHPMSSSSDETEVYNLPGSLVFEYFEQEQPHHRKPLYDKISILASQFPELKMYRSCDLSPASWICVAWYPIYRIPVGPTLQSLDASFLTFHFLSTQSKCKSQPQLHAPSTRKVHGIDASSKFSLPIFGLASYKLKGSILTPSEAHEWQQSNSLLQDAENWLRSLQCSEHGAVPTLSAKTLSPSLQRIAGLLLSSITHFQIIPLRLRERKEDMGIRSRSGNDRLRTVWTPEMDRYFIDLMLEQVNKGNKFDDHLFSKRAWKHMTNLFNSKFKFQYEKDVLKNRHKTLRNLYKAVKNLLDQRGFTWDETRQMVTAENNVWDEYIKGHPDARSFRIKTIPYYSDLCSIYRDLAPVPKGDNVPEESLLSSEKVTIEVTQPREDGDGETLAIHDIMIDEDYGISVSDKDPELDISQQAMANLSGATLSSRSRTYWQPPMDRYFIDLMLDQVRKGSRIDGVFRKQAWMEMIASFNAKFGFHYDMDVLKNRYKTLRRQYNVIKNLLDLDGFVWDDTRQMVTADDYIWQDYIKAHTDARQFMTRPVPYYKDLCVICDPSSDERECSSGQDLEQQDDEDARSPVTSVSNEVYVVSDVTSQKKRQLENCSFLAPPKKSRDKEEGMASALREMATAVSSLSDNKKNEESSIPIENVIEAVQALPDMDEDLVLDACDFLEDEKKAKTFMALDVKLRKKWLLRKLRPQA